MGHDELVVTYVDMKLKSNHGFFLNILFFKRDTAGNLKQDRVVITMQGLVHIACFPSYKV